jgi:hypothetical protein
VFFFVNRGPGAEADDLGAGDRLVSLLAAHARRYTHLPPVVKGIFRCNLSHKTSSNNA